MSAEIPLAMAVIAIAAETGWNEKFILEELPLARFLLYKHAIHWKQGDWTIPPGDSVAEQMAALGL